MVITPVLFETFVRVDYARQVWEAIKVAQPKTLYFYSNKGRAEKEGEIERNNEIRSWVNEIDWDCDLHTWFREECVDVYTSLRGAIDWLFDNEEAGIILEDDCVPTMAFFSFVDQMIEKFRNNNSVWCISGDNWFNYQSNEFDYHFSHYHFMYGWATWKDRWKMIDWNNLGIEESVNKHAYNSLYKTKEQIVYREREVIREKKFLENTKCWDMYWGIVMDQHRALTVHPKINLVHNIGVSGHHHAGAKESIVNTPAITNGDSYDIFVEPVDICADMEFDWLVYARLFKQPNIIKRIIRKIKRTIIEI